MTIPQPPLPSIVECISDPLSTGRSFLEVSATTGRGIMLKASWEDICGLESVSAMLEPAHATIVGTALMCIGKGEMSITVPTMDCEKTVKVRKNESGIGADVWIHSSWHTVGKSAARELGDRLHRLGFSPHGTVRVTYENIVRHSQKVRDSLFVQRLEAGSRNGVYDDVATLSELTVELAKLVQGVQAQLPVNEAVPVKADEPKPFKFDIPSLTDTFVLLDYQEHGLGNVLAKKVKVALHDDRAEVIALDDSEHVVERIKLSYVELGKATDCQVAEALMLGGQRKGNMSWTTYGDEATVIRFESWNDGKPPVSVTLKVHIALLNEVNDFLKDRWEK